MRFLPIILFVTGCYLGDPDPYQINSLFVNCDVFQQDTIEEVLLYESVRICANIDTLTTVILVDDILIDPVWITECPQGIQFQVFGTGEHTVMAINPICNDTLIVIGKNQ